MFLETQIYFPKKYIDANIKGLSVRRQVLVCFKAQYQNTALCQKLTSSKSSKHIKGTPGLTPQQCHSVQHQGRRSFSLVKQRLVSKYLSHLRPKLLVSLLSTEIALMVSLQTILKHSVYSPLIQKAIPQISNTDVRTLLKTNNPAHTNFSYCGSFTTAFIFL